MSEDHEHRSESILAKIAIPVVVAVLIAVIAGGTAPWWVDKVFPPESVSPAASEQPSAAEQSSAPEQPSATAQPSQAEAPPFLGLLEGGWNLETWQERAGPVTLNFQPLSGALYVDAIGHAYWDLDLDDGGPEPPATPSLRCLGVVDASAETLSRWTSGGLAVDGNGVLGNENNWTSNLNSLRGDALLAYCGSAYPETELFVYDTTQSDYALTLTTAGDGTRLLTMRNAAGTLTWREGS